MDEAQAMARFAAERVARLATVTAEGEPHAVPCCFVVDGSTTYSAVDAKPKSTAALKRLANISATARACFLVDHYDDANWAALWWIRVDGDARLVNSSEERARALSLLRAKYSQYRESPPEGDVVAVDVDRVRWWSYS